MLIRFTSSTAGEMLMLSQHLRPIFTALEKRPTARGVFTLEQLPAAISALQAAITTHENEIEEAPRAPHEDTAPCDNDTEDKAFSGISFKQRATPFLLFMVRTLNAKGYITWEAPHDFG